MNMAAAALLLVPAEQPLLVSPSNHQPHVLQDRPQPARRGTLGSGQTSPISLLYIYLLFILVFL